MANPHWVHSDHLLVVTAAPDPLLTLAEAKDHLEIDHTDKDALITSLVAAASQMIDGYDGMTGKAINTQTIKVSYRNAPGDHIDLQVFPVRALQAVSYFDETNTQQTINVNQFTLVSNEDYAWLEPIDGFTYPTLFDRADAISFTLQCGFAETPEPIKHAARLMVAHWFENREAASEKSVKSIDWAVDALIGRYKKGWIGS